MFWLLKKLLRKRKIASAANEAIEVPRTTKTRQATPEWELELLESLVRNNLAPSEEVILHSFDLYRGEKFDPLREQRLVLAGRYTAILAKFAKLRGLVPDMIDRAADQPPFEFSQPHPYREVR